MQIGAVVSIVSLLIVSGDSYGKINFQKSSPPPSTTEKFMFEPTPTNYGLNQGFTAVCIGGKFEDYIPPPDDGSAFQCDTGLIAVLPDDDKLFSVESSILCQDKVELKKVTDSGTEKVLIKCKLKVSSAFAFGSGINNNERNCPPGTSFSDLTRSCQVVWGSGNR